MNNNPKITIKAKQKINFIKSDIKLTIGILVSNHIKYIRKGMEAIKPLLDAVPSELIVVDTVGEENSDGSLAVVKEYPDKIYHFDWINDFSAARNVAIDHARGEWFMYFDDDEYFDDVTEFIEFFNSVECNKYNVGFYFTGDYITPTTFKKSIAGRMVRRTPETRFEGRIHEGFVNAFLPIKQFNVFTHHFGYLYENEDQRKAKTKRNLTLLEQELKDKGYGIRVCAQIVQEIMIFDQEEGSKRCTEYLEILDKLGESEDSGYQWLLVSRIRFMANWRSLEGILGLEKMTLEKYKLSQMARLAIAQLVAAVAYFYDKFDIVADRVKTYLEMYDWLMSHDADRAIQSNLDFPSFMYDEVLYGTILMGAESEKRLKNYDVAYSYIKRLDFDYCNDFEGLKGLVRSIIRGMDDPAPTIDWYKRFYRDELFNDKNYHKYLPADVRERFADAEKK